MTAGAMVIERDVVRRLRRRLIGFVVVLGCLAVALPDPVSWWRSITVGPVTNAAQALDLVGGALLAAAGMAVWTLLGWSLVITGAVGMSRLSGRAGRVGRATVDRLAPRPVLRILSVAVGLSVVAGTSGCAALPMATAGAPPTATSESAAPRSGAHSTADGAVDIDWPATPATPASVPTALSPADASTGPAPAGTTGTATTTATAPTSAPAPGGSSAAAPTTTIASTSGDIAPSVGAGTSSSPQPQPMATNTQLSAPVTAPTGVGAAVASATQAGPTADASPSTPRTGPSRAASHATTDRPQAAPERGDAEAQNPWAPSRRTPASAVTVRPGDTLWAIAQRALPAPASDNTIDAEWRAWYVANAGVIGTDPDLIQPGQHLLAPTFESRLT